MLEIEVTVTASREKVWRYWNESEHVQQWYNLDESWHCPSAVNDFDVGGSFTYRLEGKDGNGGFDFGGTYTELKDQELISYGMKDGRKEIITFQSVENDQVRIVRRFDPHTMYDGEAQKAGWQTVLNSFKKYVESH
jgi:uncharacterized protein YndB with AHSA1/START domain